MDTSPSHPRLAAGSMQDAVLVHSLVLVPEWLVEQRRQPAAPLRQQVLLLVAVAPNAPQPPHHVLACWA